MPYLCSKAGCSKTKPRSDGAPGRRPARAVVFGVHAVALAAEGTPPVRAAIRAEVYELGEVRRPEDDCALGL